MENSLKIFREGHRDSYIVASKDKNDKWVKEQFEGQIGDYSERLYNLLIDYWETVRQSPPSSHIKAVYEFYCYDNGIQLAFHNVPSEIKESNFYSFIEKVLKFIDKKATQSKEQMIQQGEWEREEYESFCKARRACGGLLLR